MSDAYSAYDPAQYEIDQRKKIAAGLLGTQNAQPVDLGHGVSFVSPWQTLADSLAKVYGGYLQGKANRAQGKLSQQRAGAYAAALRGGDPNEPDTFLGRLQANAGAMQDPGMMAQYMPQVVQGQIQQDQQAHQPITPYQQAEIDATGKMRADNLQLQRDQLAEMQRYHSGELAMQRQNTGMARLPPGYRMTAQGNLEFIPGGPADPAMAFSSKRPATDTERITALYADRAGKSNSIIEKPEIQQSGLSVWQQGLGHAPMGNFMVSPEYQKYDQATRDFVNAVLRRESGAVISPSEFENARKQYFPQPGDKPDVLEQKRQNRITAINGLSLAAGPAMQGLAQFAPQQMEQAAPQAQAPQPSNRIRYDANGNRIP